MSSSARPDAADGSSRAALWACLAAGFATLFDATAITYTVPAVSSTLGGGTPGVQWLLASFSLTFGLGLVPGGRLGDAYGRRGLFAVGLGTFLVGGVLAVAAPGIGVLVAARLVQGLGAGVISAQVLGAIQDLFLGAARLRALGAYTAVGALAGFLGPIASAVALGSTPPEAAWRLVLFLPLPFAGLALWLGRRGLPRGSGSHARVSLDLPAIGLLGGIVLAVTLPVIEPGLPAPVVVGLVAGCGIAAAALALWERRHAARGRVPLFAPALIRSRGFVAGNVVAMTWFGATLALGSVATVYFLQRPDLSALTIALVFAPGALARLAVSLFSQRIFARLGPSTVPLGLSLQGALIAAVAIAAPLVPDGTLFVLTAIAQVGLGASGGLVEPPLRVMTLSFAPPGLHGVAASFLQLTQRLSATYLIALATGILLGAAGVGSPASLRAALLACAVASAIALAVSLAPSFRAAAPPRRT
ncbi:MFS transporter [Microbacterium betulae]|uniref:MFS transporter n=1 Tax=Microbacterium betulae TaxID=2981139 RepID=A0AA97I501_9MICO|nr:MFS transporter [Microbacterium sp. AB]WOF23146.1 MFS transporter [Microbacterium sp. AB]